MELSLTWQLTLIFILLGLNAFFAASEIAIISLNDQKLRRQAESGDKKAELLYALIKEPSRFLATIQVGATLTSLLTGAAATQSFAAVLARWLARRGIPFSHLLALALITVILTYITLVVGELVPKRLAMQHSSRISRFSVSPLTILSRIAAPFIRFLSFSTNIVIRWLGGDPTFNEKNITEEEIRLMIDVGQEKGAIRRDEREMIHNIFNFDNTHVSQVMTHRTEISGIPLSHSLIETAEYLAQVQYSRVPIYDETIDHIIGVLHVKDLLPYLRSMHELKDFSLVTVMRQPLYVPETKKTHELLKELQRNKTHMAIVIDEYGGTAGIVTLEDLVEEIVGNIWDEYDVEENEIEQLDEGTLRVDGSMELDRLEEIFKVKLPSEDYDTLSGFLVGQLGRIPEADETPTLEFGSLIFKVEAMEEKRIATVQISRNKLNIR